MSAKKSVNTTNIIINACSKNPEANYKLGEFHEYGTNGFCIDLRGATEYYTKAFMYSGTNLVLNEKAEHALKRVQLKYEFKESKF